MEILIVTFSALTLLTVVVLIGTRGRPMRFFTAFGETLRGLWTNRLPLGITILCVVLVLVFLSLFYMPPAADIGPEQPIPFSHQLHAGVKAIDCYFCHSNVARSIHPGIPPVEKCLFCHNYIIADHPQIRKEHDYFNSNTPTPWVKAFYVAEHVVFKHQRHIRKEIACQSCHGRIETMDRIKGGRFKMGFCVNCHRQKGANVDCWLACHN